MALFHYPKNKHSRKLSPGPFRRYGTYKRYLQTEFSRVCIYCRQPDSSAPNLNFGVDHYRPKSIQKFAALVCDYTNLYYCCGNCNSRKQDDWPKDERVGPFVVNPCDHEMAKHLVFDAKTGQVVPKSPDGVHTEKLLQLNDKASIQYRLGTLATLQLYTAEIAQQEKQLAQLSILLEAGKLQLDDYEREARDINQDLARLRETMWAHSGDLPLLPLAKKRGNITVLVG